MKSLRTNVNDCVRLEYKNKKEKRLELYEYTIASPVSLLYFMVEVFNPSIHFIENRHLPLLLHPSEQYIYKLYICVRRRCIEYL